MLLFLISASLSATPCVHTQPAIAFAHPGMVQVCDAVYAEGPLSEADRKALVTAWVDVHKRIQELFGGEQSVQDRRL